MNNIELQNYIYENIPLSKAMGIMVIKATSDNVILNAPLNLNMNHKKTAFGGSLQSLATLCCWCLVHINLQNFNAPVEIVISKSEIKYLLPVTDDFKAECLLKDKKAFMHFKDSLKKRSKARIQLKAKIFQDSKLAVDYIGEFVALKKL